MKISNLSIFRLIVLLGCCTLMWERTAPAQLNFDGALAIWLLDEGRGVDVEDFSGNDNGGAFAQGKPEWVDGKFGKALEFDQQSWVTMNNPVVTVKGMIDFSIGCWANPENQQNTWTNILSSHQEPPRRGLSFEMFENQTNFFGIAFGDGENWAGGGWAQLKTGVWNHMVFVRTGNIGIWYVDGEKFMDVRLPSDKPVQAATSNFRIGNWVLGTREYNGMVDEAFIFSRALEVEEVQSIYKRGFENAQAVTSKGKSTTTWGKIKSWHQ